MSETKELLRRGVGGFEPTPDAFERVTARRDRRQRNQRVAAGLLGIAVFALAAIGLGRLLGSETTPASDPRDPFLGVWISTSDADGGTQTMTVSASADDAVEIAVTDDVATVCSGTPSTMTGIGRIEGGTALVIPSPVYTCDDGSEPEALSGPPLEEQLRDWTLFLDPETGTLSDGLDGLWVWEGAEVPGPEPTTTGAMWPQTSLEEVRQAQERADAGDPDYTWQVEPELGLLGDDDPFGTEVSERFLHEGLGWEEFLDVSSSTYIEAGGPDVNAVVYLRCAPGRMNPLSNVYPDMPLEVRGCAPTIDDFRYEAVKLTVGQPARRGPSGIWVVTAWEMLQPAEQAAPPSDAEVTALMLAFLGARVDGEGAEEYLLPRGEAEGLPFLDGEAPLLHATTGGSPYERSEIERVQGPLWPAGWIEFKVRLFAEDGTVVEQHFVVVRQENGRLGLVYGSASEYGEPPTIENGQALYSLLDGEVTFAAASPWRARLAGPTSMDLELGCKGTGFCSDNFVVAADPLTLTGCEAGPVPADAEALAGSIRSNPDLETTAPVAVSVGGIDALRMDVVAAPRASACAMPLVLAEHVGLLPTDRMRLYLLDLPGGSARILAIAVIARDPYGEVQVPQSDFEHVVEAATPIVNSFEFHTP